jgi:hypothetical protein
MTSARADQPTALAPVVRFGNSLVALASVLGGKAMIACRLRQAPEGWRRTLGILLRSEPTRFALSAFGLRLPDTSAGDEDVRRRAADELRRYLAGQPDAYFALEWLDVITLRRRLTSVDVALLQFSADGGLAGVIPYFDPSPAVTLQSARVNQALIASYNSTRHLPEVQRPRAIKRAIEASCALESDAATAAGMRRYAERLLTACCVSFESVDLSDPALRFRPPAFHLRRTLGFGVLSVVMRLAPTGRSVDVWMSAHHVGLDGVPLQELVAGLERAWGRNEPVMFPSPDRDRPFMGARTCSVPGERSVEEMLAFLDFSPVIALREMLNARHAAAVGAPITFGSVLAWLFSLEPEFAGLRIASTVDVASSGGYERDVDVVPLRPADFAGGGDPWNGIVPFATEFNRLIALSRTRTSPLRRNMQTAGLLPPQIHSQAVYANPAALDDTFGSLCITIIREASVFVAPMTDLGLGHGFFAIGSTSLPSADGGRVTAVSIKGEAGTVARNYAVLQRVIARSRAIQTQSV